MKLVFEKAPLGVFDMMNSVKAQYHPHLDSVAATIGITFVFGYDSEDQPVPALKHGGYFTPGQVRLIKGKNRVNNPNDFEILLDHSFWDTATEETRKAILDHELNHVKCKTDRAGVPQVDQDTGRPHLRLIKDDFCINGFFDVIRRHGPAAVEANSVQGVAHGVYATLMVSFRSAADQLIRIITQPATD